MSIARQSITDRDGNLYGHELFFRGARTLDRLTTSDLQATAYVVEAAVGHIGLSEISPEGAYFLNCSSAFLSSPLVHLLPKDRFVLEILETCELDDALYDQCLELKQMGFRLALDDVRFRSGEIDRFLAIVDIIKIDWPFVEPADRAGLVHSIKSFGKLILAEKIETREDFDLARQYGCDLFQGYYFCKPVLMTSKKPPHDFLTVVEILKLATSNVGMGQLQRAIERCPALCAQIFRLANAGSIVRHNTRQFESLSHALGIVGTRRVAYWCVVIIYGNNFTIDLDPLVDLAWRRAERIAEHLRAATAGEDDVQQGRLVGLLSLVHVGYGMTIEAFWKSFPIHGEIKRAITENDGLLGEALAQTIRTERIDEVVAAEDAEQGAEPD